MQNSINWNRIYLDHSPKLLGICRRYVQEQAAAEDILQDSFLTAIQKQHQLRDINLLFPWLKKIVVNNALHYLKTSNQSLFVNTENQEIPDHSSSMTQTIEEHSLILGYDFTTDELLWSIDQLPAHHRSVFNMYYLENFSHAEIAESLGININTSKSHLLRAKKGIQQHLIKKTEGKSIPLLRKKGIQALVFLGFGNLLFAQAFRNKFRNFTVQPEKNFDFSDFGDLPVSIGSGINFQNVFLKRAFTLMLFFSGILLFNNIKFSNGANSHLVNYQNSLTNNDNNKKIEEDVTTENTKAKTVSESQAKNHQTVHVENTEKNSLAKAKTTNKTNTNENRKIFKVNTPEVETTPVIAVADTSVTEKKPVVIVKKVVKKVKVYVEK